MFKFNNLHIKSFARSLSFAAPGRNVRAAGRLLAGMRG
jgi:hypothetical protein